MAFSISEFISNVSSKNGFSRSSHYTLEIILPAFLRNKYKYDNITMSASMVTIPAVRLDVSPHRRGGTTYLEYFPTNVSYDTLPVSFLSDGEGEMLSLFREWIDEIFTAVGESGTGQDKYNGNGFRVAYRNDYVAPKAIIKHFDVQGNIIATYTFFDVFPETLQSINLNWAAKNEIVSVPVTFRYRTYTHHKESKPFSSSLGPTQQAPRNNTEVNPKI